MELAFNFKGHCNFLSHVTTNLMKTKNLIMKSLKLLVLLASLSTSSAFASGLESQKLDSAQQNNLIVLQISSKLQMPEALINHMSSGPVLIEFEIQENHQIKILHLQCTDNFVALHLRKQIESLKIYVAQAQEFQKYRLKLRF